MKALKKLGIAIPVMMVLTLLLVGGYNKFRKTHFAFGTTFLGQSLSLKTVAEAYEILEKANVPTIIKLTGQNKTYEVKIPPKYRLNKEELVASLPESELKLSENKDFEHELISRLKEIDFDEQEGVDAFLALEGKEWKITPEVPGTKIDRPKVTKKIMDLVSSGDKKEVNLADFYQPVKVSAKDQGLIKRCKWCNDLIKKEITVKVQKQTRQISQADLVKFLDSQGEINPEEVTSYLQRLNKDVSPLSKDVRWKNPGDGKTYQYLNNFAWGWEIKIDDAGKKLITELKKSQPAQMIVLPITDEQEGEEIKDNFIWINLLEQTMRVYRDGQEKLSTRIISGRNNKGTATVPAFYTIAYKSPCQTLSGVGIDGIHYSVPTYIGFMPLLSRGQGKPYATGIGIHDADKDFSSLSAWMTLSGSNGCINTPLEAMRQVWDLAYPGMAVFITGDLYVNSPGEYDKPVDFGKEVG